VNLRAAVLIAAVVVSGLTGATVAPPPPTHFKASPAVVQAAPVTFASEGDSISALYDNNKKTIWWSWVRDAVARGGLKYVGVYMRAGAATPELASKAVPTRATVMVVMAGTNDVSQNLPTSRTLANVTAIFAKTGATHKVLSAIAPRNQDHTAQTLALNAALQQLAYERGWTFVDPWVSVRATNGTYKPGTNADRLHPTPATGQIVGQILHDTIVKVAR
jgi:lysophospholipase L1-like esterase